MSSATVPSSHLPAPAAAVRPGSARAWLLAARPATLTVALVPVLVGTAIAHRLGGVRPVTALLALAGAVLIQIGTNFANDVFDFEKGADTGERVGPTRAVQAGLLTARQARAGLALSFALAAAIGCYLVWVGGWPIAVVGLASLVSGVAYTGGPWPLGYNGLGDVFVFAFFGLVAVSCTALLQLGHVPPLAFAAALPVGAIATAVLVVNNVRDHETDARAGKRTLVVRFGRGFGVVEYAALLGTAYVVPLVLALLGSSSPWVLLSWLTAPLAVLLVRRVAKAKGAALNPYLGATARLLLVHGVLFALGLAR